MPEDASLAAAVAETTDEDAARAFLERLRWPDAPVCPHCGGIGAYRLRPRTLSARPVRKGVLKCRRCRRQFTVTVGTAFERSHIPLRRWLLVIGRLCESGSAPSVYQLQRLAEVSYQSAESMLQRIYQPRHVARSRDKPGSVVAVEEVLSRMMTAKRPGRVSRFKPRPRR